MRHAKPKKAMSRETIIRNDSEKVCKITLNRPDKLNAINMEMREELNRLFTEIIADKSVNAIVIAGAGRAFCAGADVEELSTGAGGSSGALLSRRLYRTIETCPKPTVAAIHGFALGGGLELALSCDFRIASKDSELGLTELRLGTIPGAGGTQRLPRIVGIPKAKELIFLAKRISATEALACSLVNQVVEEDKLEDAVNGLARALAQTAPVAIASAKLAISKVWDFVSIDDGLVWERDLGNLVGETKDKKEGISAFLERRKPNFVGE